MNFKQLILPALLIHALSASSLIANVTSIPAGLRCLPEEQCADLVLQLAGQTPTGSLDDKKQAVHHLSKSQLVTVTLGLIDRLLNPNPQADDNKNRVPWIGHCERLIFVLQHASIPLDSEVITAAINTLNKYRGVASLGEFANDDSSFHKECRAVVQTIMPKLIAASIKLLPECDAVCNPEVINEATEILKRNANSDTAKLLAELQHLLPQILQNPDIKHQVEHIQALLVKNVINNRFTRLYRLNADWLKSHGLKHS